MSDLPFAIKSLGQHFLVDKSAINKIVDAIDPQVGENIIEIGPGPAVITRPLLERGANVIVVELDERMVDIAEELSKEFPGQMTIHHADALKIDLTTLSQEKCKLVGNLPYNVGTQIVFNAIQHPQKFSHMVFMLQKEVIQRICATNGNKSWGRIGVWCDLTCERKKLFDVPAGAFRPAPKVVSSVVSLTPRPSPKCDVEFAKLSRLLDKSFQQRRKMLRASLKGLLTEEQISATGIAPTLRPEQLTTEQLCALASLL